MRTYRYTPSIFDVVADLLAWLRPTPPTHLSIDPSNIVVVDGDTIRIAGTRYRIANLNAPEIFKPRCTDELALGLEARHDLISLVRSASRIDLTAAGFDHYRRVLCTLYVDGTDVAELMLARGHVNLGEPTPRSHHWCTCSV